MSPHHKVVQHTHIDQLQAALERLRQQFVRARGFQHAGRVVVRQDHTGGVQFQRALDHLAGVDAGLCERAPKQLLASNQPLLGVEKQHREHLVVQRPQPHLQIVFDQLRRAEHRLRAQLTAQAATGHLHHGEQLGAFGRAQSLDLTEL